MLAPTVLLLCMLSFCSCASLFDFSAKLLKGDTISLATFQNAKVILVVNVASNCAHARDHYKELSQLYDRLKPRGLEILGVHYSCLLFIALYWIG